MPITECSALLRTAFWRKHVHAGSMQDRGAQTGCLVAYPPRQWAQVTRRDGRVTNPLPENLVAEVAKLRRENHKLRSTDELLQAASAFSHRNQVRNLKK